MVTMLMVVIYLVSVIHARVIAHGETRKMASEFFCEDPQPRAYTVVELTKETEHDPYNDPFVVLHRCERAGCCIEESETCSPSIITNVELTVEVIRGGTKKKIAVPAFNHTKCECR